MALPVYLVDAFASTPFSGNQAAVVLVPRADALDDATMQKVAAEFNVSETSFVMPSAGANMYHLRWFTPTTEVPLCGHATLAAAAVLFESSASKDGSSGGSTDPRVRFLTQSGVLTVERKQTERSASQLLMRLPLAQPSPILPPPFVSACTSAAPGSSGFNADAQPPQAQALLQACGLGTGVQVVDAAYSPSLKYLMLRLSDDTTRAQLEAISPDFTAMHESAQGKHVSGLIITCQGGDSEYDFLSRFFAPWMGIREDPVTGSAHALLGPYWSEHCGAEACPGKAPSSSSGQGRCSLLSARQCSKRGGELQVAVQHDELCVDILGSAIIVMSGQLHL